ncbi:MAG: ATP-binding protein [Alphaproteobacteria bacterium]|nr:ATP-binding protein [Alphaproteobacteria bacterium]
MHARPAYWWQTRHPHPRIDRSELIDELCDKLLNGTNFVLIGGHGMGKTVLLSQLQEELPRRNPATRVLLFEEARGEITKYSMARDLVTELGGEPREDGAVIPILQRWATENPETQLVLLYDELDRYAAGSAGQAARFFNDLQKAYERLESRLTVVAAGGLGVYLIGDHEFGSSFFSPATKRTLDPFTVQEISTLIDEGPLHESLPPDAPEAIHLLSGGHPELTNWFLMRLHQLVEADRAIDLVSDLPTLAMEFRNDTDIIDSVHRSVGVNTEDDQPFRLWQFAKVTPPPQTLADASEALNTTLTKRRTRRLVSVLTAAGLLRADEGMDPLHLEVIPSLLNLPDSTAVQRDLTAQLRSDLDQIAPKLHRWGPDFYQGQNDKRGLVEEATVSAFLGVALQFLGWRFVDRETLAGGGRADLRVMGHIRHPDEHAIIEVKRWNNKDLPDAHAQVLRSRTDQAKALAVFVVRGSSQDVVEEDYATKVLGDHRVDDRALHTGWLRLTAGDPPVDHYLVHLGSRNT